LSAAAKEYDYVKLPSKDVQLVDPSGRKVVAVIEQRDATGSKQRRTHGGLRTRGGASDASVTGKTDSPDHSLGPSLLHRGMVFLARLRHDASQYMDDALGRRVGVVSHVRTRLADP
jgi:hypothetical protein